MVFFRYPGNEAGRKLEKNQSKKETLDPGKGSDQQ